MSQSDSFLRRRGIDSLREVRFSDIKNAVSLLTMSVWTKTSRRMRLLGAFVILFFFAFFFSDSLLSAGNVNYPTIKFEYANQPQRSTFNESKVGLLIENRPFPVLAPLMLHFISVVPPDWRFRFMGSIESVKKINESVAIQEQVKAGKLDLTYIPSNMSTGSQEEISRFLTTRWLYEVVLQPAEWLLVFQTDSILCANSQHNLNEYLEYDWIGAPWSTHSRWGGNGGLSIRRVSAMVDILKDQVRVDGSEPEDVWLAERLGHRPKSKVANGTVSLTFSGEMHLGEGARLENMTVSAASKDELEEAAREGKLVKGVDDWRAGFYEPMGYHTGGSGKYLHKEIWGEPERREHVWKYCPEVKMTLAMDAAKFVPGTCGASWKRSVDIPGMSPGIVDVGYGSEIINDVQYPVLPPTLVPW
ncbi:uncharacterized protein SPSK_07560 [Sporothrix schenckii 1099-18]|uniref:DUF5672 domain-containing protein n=2 Tax=Sporothrix schenckii TaxID=29908 RepID=U7Q2Z4_SPOS1|nr:uncharacterized protein SPSK_07560 [Sporothrix schenckii 1099-18]ERT01532.1 hypothetical protein HMPREF1624_02783 [Sporothrix schenckii ATCC 58251]KJR88743.1 hypothetical protein SPSK_07560 [Sporothrix schenckii 1099-18]